MHGDMNIRPAHEIRLGDALTVLRSMESESVQCCVTSPPYFGLRDYGTAEWDISNAEDAEIAEKCDHKGDERFYSMQGASSVTSEAFSEAGEANADRLKKARWREKGTCIHCGAVRIDAQIGLEATPAEFVARLVEVFEEVRRVLKKDGTLWLNLGDSYFGGGYSNHDINGESWKDRMNGDKRSSRQQDIKRNNPGIKPKDLVGIPWRVAFALQEAGWWLRQDIIWHKPNPMPESVTDRCTKAHEYIFLLTKSAKYFYDAEAIKEPLKDYERNYRRLLDDDMNGRKQQYDGISKSGQGINPKTAEAVRHRLLESGVANKRSVWTVTTQPYSEAHFATFPPKLIEPCVLAGTSEKGCCASCGAPYERITTLVGRQVTEAMKIAGCDVNGEYHGDATKDYESANAQNASDTKRRILESMSQVKESGWQKTCKCETEEIVPCTVLDPFSGAGTTGLVSLRHRRNYIGIELNPEYIKIAEKRLSDVQVKLF